MHYVELHATSAFSFLRGGSSPEQLVATAATLGLPGIALCDRNGIYGAVRAHMAAKEAGVRNWVGAEIVMEGDDVVPLIAATREGYQNLCRLLTVAKLRADKGQARATWEELARYSPGLVAFTGDQDGPLLRAWHRGDHATMEANLVRLTQVFGPTRLHVELQRHHLRGEDRAEAALVALARKHRLPLLATNGIAYATREARRVADVFTCLRHHTTLDGAGALLSVNAERHLKTSRAMEALFADLPEAVANTGRLAETLEFTLSDLGYRFPDYRVPGGDSQDSFLKKMTLFGAQQRYGSVTGKVRKQLDHELALIGKLGFSGYFLVVWDICNFCREQGILVQGRGSAANSAVCYSLGITAVDPIAQKLLFERFLSEGRSDWPDIDLDLPSGERRERVIQEVFRRYGHRAAMTANVITYRGRSSMREVGKVLGFPDDALDRFSRLYAGGDYPQTLGIDEQLGMAGVSLDHPRSRALLELMASLRGLPRHLGQHSGGVVLCATLLDEIVPLENAAMPGRVVIEWDKSDCEDMGIIKVDLLGLGMMAVMEDSLAACQERGCPVDLARIPKDDAETFALLQRADTIGVFQVESRAQMATLPIMKPVNFYDLAVEVAIIRPGPIHGNAVHPYLARRGGREPVTYFDERARPILERTLGVVLFQEQVLSLAMVLGGFTPSEADELRRAIGFTRSPERLEKSKARLREAMRARAVSESAVAHILEALGSFALYGFPESHALSFALIAYASAWLKVHRPAEFFASLLNNQPMGFYGPATLVQDARRHGITVRPVCVVASACVCTVVEDRVIRLGLGLVQGLRRSSAEALVAARGTTGFSSLADFLRRVRLNETERRALAGSGALNGIAGNRRQALWEMSRQDLQDDLFADTIESDDASVALLTPMPVLERLAHDFAIIGLTVGDHPMKHLRARFPDLWRADELPLAKDGDRVRVGGSVICRQRPGTAKGVVFISLEDESGITNAVVMPAMFEKRRLAITQSAALVIEGKVQSREGVIHVLAERLDPLVASDLPVGASHDFH
jgi:error-prone DNA polymerase